MVTMIIIIAVVIIIDIIYHLSRCISFILSSLNISIYIYPGPQTCKRTSIMMKRIIILIRPILINILSIIVVVIIIIGGSIT